MRRPARPALSDEQLAIAWQSASLLLGYPEEQLVADLGTVTAALPLLPPAVADPLTELATYLSTTPLEQLQQEYVSTFDQQRRSSLFLTYFAHGDTRKRGMALLRLKQTYLRAGHLLDDTELPDHLCVVLEFGAVVDRETGWRLLHDHRAGLEVLRLSLRDAGSPWLPGVEAVSATLESLSGDDWDVVRRLVAEGPPDEEVGLDGYGGAGPHNGPQLLPDPVLRSR